MIDVPFCREPEHKNACCLCGEQGASLGGAGPYTIGLQRLTYINDFYSVETVYFCEVCVAEKISGKKWSDLVGWKAKREVKSIE